MVSSQLLTGVLALLAANAVSAGPCKPSSSTIDTTTTVETTTTETSSATVSESSTESLTSLGSTETTDTNSLSTSAETSTVLGTSTTFLITTTEEPTSSAAASATTSAAAAVECTTNADCDGATPFCDAGTCVATDPNAECSTNAECTALYGGDAPFCSAAGNCIGCRGDGDCYGETPYCDDNFCNDYIGLVGGGFKMRR
ncbi:hypothetical protein H9Q69_007531 [Fusarium xylarioides]|uniref:Uncharacterized protein n=1 Tax=Fusarium xylarioides TaxID=221167 RepID=A0A9P7I0L3_9HYPO|nr:hypothetical protein H9Q72_005240 [Fusarium xylarioides]KAG5793409.1 hypothetical protein H9Q69_007531 [Fusarium xylarioides]KAG5823114.1 hypothetical protein H9Q74_006778 [Fusarium xylarioides]